MPVFPVSQFQTLREQYLTVSGTLGESASRTANLNSPFTLANQTLTLTAVPLPAGVAVGHIAWTSGGTGVTGPVHWWYGLYDNNRNQLAVTADQTTTAFGSNTYMPLAIATTAAGSASSFVTTYTGLYYAGIMVDASSSPCNVLAYAHNNTAVMIQAPVLWGTSDTSQTTPPSFPHQATSLTTSTTDVPYAIVTT
jgi:hypothetical protein